MEYSNLRVLRIRFLQACQRPTMQISVTAVTANYSGRASVATRLWSMLRALMLRP